MYEPYKEFAKLTSAEINEHKKKVCSKCEYLSRNGADNKKQCYTDSTCEYIHIAGMMRGCLPTECVEKGIFKPRSKKRKTKKPTI